jgi:hypothetical protein
MKSIKILALIAGMFCFTNSFCQYAGVTSIGSTTACPGTIITIPVYLLHSPLIDGISLCVNYDGSVLSALQNGSTSVFLTNVNNALLPIGMWNYAQTDKPGYPGIKRAIFAWNNLTPAQVDTNSNGYAELFDIQFRYMGGSTTLTFDNSTTLGSFCEYADAIGNPLIDIPSSNYYIPGNVTQCSTGIADNDADKVFSVSNYPNPFSQKTKINFILPEPGIVTVDIFDIFGKLLFNVTDNYFTRGNHETFVNMSGFADGLYFYKIKYYLNGNVFSKTCLMNNIK